MAVSRVSLSQLFAPALLLIALLSVFHAAQAADPSITIAGDGTKTSAYSNGTTIIEDKWDNGVYNVTIIQNGTVANRYNATTSPTTGKSAGRVFAASTLLVTVAVAFLTAGVLKVAA